MIFVATERLVPLSWDTKRGALNNDILRWGLFSISVLLLLGGSGLILGGRGRSNFCMSRRRVSMEMCGCRLFILLKLGNGNFQDWKS